MAEDGHEIDKLKIEFEVDTKQAKRALRDLDKVASGGSSSSTSSRRRTSKEATQDETDAGAKNISSALSVLPKYTTALSTYRKKWKDNNQFYWETTAKHINEASKATANFNEKLKGTHNAEKGTNELAENAKKFQTIFSGLGSILSKFSGGAKLGGFFQKIGSISGSVGKLAKIEDIAKNIGSAFSGLASTGTAAFGLTGAAVAAVIKILVKLEKIYLKVVGKIIKGTIAVGKAIVKYIGDKLSSITAPLKYFLQRFKGVALQRLIRSMLMAFKNALKEGVENVAKGSERANKVLSQYSTQLMYLKNTIGAAVVPALEMLYPLFEKITNAVINATNGINQFLTILSGKTTYIKAKKLYVDYADSVDKSSKKAKKSVSKLTASFDELNDLTESVSDSSDTDDMTSYFTTKGIESSVSDFFKRVKAEFEKGDMTGVGKSIAQKFNVEIAKLDSLIKWENIGLKVMTAINSITSLLNSLLKNINWYGLGELVGDGIDAVFKALVHFEERFNFKGLGAAIAQILNGLFDNMPWKEMGEHFADKFINIFKILDGFINGDGELNGFSFSKLASDIVTAIDSALRKFIENGEMIGNTITNILIAGFKFATGILQDDRGGTLGAKLALAINSIVKGMETKKVARTIALFIETAIKAFADFVNTVDWKEVGKAISDVISGLNQKPVIDAFKTLFKAALKAAFNLIGGFLEGLLSDAVSRLITKVTKKYFPAGVTVPVSGKSSHPGPTRGYATGGFPEDGLFMANQGEVVGKFSNGKTAVANNAQIVAGIASGVYDAMMAALSQQKTGGNNVYMDGAKVGRVAAQYVYGELVRAGVVR